MRFTKVILSAKEYEAAQVIKAAAGACVSVNCAECPLSEIGCIEFSRHMASKGRLKAVEKLLEICEVEFEAYSLPIWLDTERPTSKIVDGVQTLNKYLLGESDWSWKGPSSKHIHEFKIIIEQILPPSRQPKETL